MTLDFNVGDTVYYLLRRAPSNGRDTDWYLECTVLSINKYIRIKPKGDRYSRNAKANHLCTRDELPAGAVIK